jgi:glucose/arabinose dehydrogenase
MLSSRTSFAVAAAVLVASPAVGQLTSSVVADGFNDPLFVTAAPGDDSTLYVVEQGGRIKTVGLDGSTGGMFLDLSGQISTVGNEQGLLGLAFAPNFASSGEFYVHYTNTSGDTAVARHRVDSNGVADPNGNVILNVAQPQRNHNGGWIGFSPIDGQNLYVSLGDGGGGDDNDAGHTPGIGNAQDNDKRLGKLLRLDVGGSDFNRTFGTPVDNPFVGQPGDDLIVATGLRNGYRASFDRETGDFYVGDVGQNRREEINLMPAGELGYNFGWRPREGYIATPTGNVGGPRPTGAVDPIFDYAHSEESAGIGSPGTGDRPILGRSVTGGYVYRGDDLGPNYQGKYIFGDFVSGRVFALDLAQTAGFDDVTDFADLEDLDLPLEELTGAIFPDGAPTFDLASFGEDADGELYITTFDGRLTRLEFDVTPGDATYDGSVDLADFGVLRANFGREDDDLRFQDADFNGDFVVNLADFGILRANFGSGDTNTIDAWAASVPEPATLTLLAAGGFTLLRRR